MIKTTYSEDDILKSFKNAPEAVREILSSGDLVELIFDMVKENSLPAEKTVLVARYNRDLLLGLSSPAEVLGNLIFAGIPADKAQKILEELNQKVFIPTHKKVRDEATKKHEQIPAETHNNEKPQQQNHTADVETQDTPQTKETNTYVKQEEVQPNIQIEHHQNILLQEKPGVEPEEVKKPKIESPGRKPVIDPYRESF